VDIVLPNDDKYFMAQRIYPLEELGMFLRMVGSEKDMDKFVGFIPIFKGEFTSQKYAPSTQQINVKVESNPIKKLNEAEKIMKPFDKK
jgi:hypothetical protein